MSEPREIWVEIDEESVDRDKLTHIAQHENFDDRESMHFIQKSAYDTVVKERDEARAEVGRLIKAIDFVRNHKLDIPVMENGSYITGRMILQRAINRKG